MKTHFGVILPEIPKNSNPNQPSKTKVEKTMKRLFNNPDLLNVRANVHPAIGITYEQKRFNMDAFNFRVFISNHVAEKLGLKTVNKKLIQVLPWNNYSDLVAMSRKNSQNAPQLWKLLESIEYLDSIFRQVNKLSLPEKPYFYLAGEDEFEGDDALNEQEKVKENEC